MGLLDNTLTWRYEYSRSNRENLKLPNQIKLSKKRESFRGISFAFLISALNCQCSERKYGYHKSGISEVIDSERSAYFKASEGFSLKTLCQ